FILQNPSNQPISKYPHARIATKITTTRSLRMTNRRFVAITCALLTCWISLLAPADGAPAADRSLSGEQYIARGAPPTTRPWTGKDYSLAADTLKRIAAADVSLLPRYKSAKSGAYFDRIISQ